MAQAGGRDAVGRHRRHDTRARAGSLCRGRGYCFGCHRHHAESRPRGPHPRMAAGGGMTRYARQMVLPEVGAAGQERISAARVLIVGAGGLGVPALQYLAGAGIGQITLIDADTVEETNLHRQPLYRIDDIGQPKVRAAAQALARLNPAVKVEALKDPLTPVNAPALIAAADVVLDCADSYAASYTLSDGCLAAGKPLISASALGLSGYVGGF